MRTDPFTVAAGRSDRPDPAYVLGRSDEEYARLMEQAAVLEPMTRRLLTTAGIRPGMHVVDVGCGVGDVTMLLADLVGPTGSVVGVDADARALEVANSRAAEAGLGTVSFVCSDLRSFSLTEPADAAVGRLVLMYLADPADALQRLACLVRPGGVLVFQEIDMDLPSLSEPPLPLWDCTIGAIRQAFRAGRCDTRMARRLYGAFRSADLPDPTLVPDLLLGGGPQLAVYSWAATTMRNLLPVLRRAGIVVHSSLGASDLADLLRDEVVAGGGVVASPLFVGAYATVPAR